MVPKQFMAAIALLLFSATAGQAQSGGDLPTRLMNVVFTELERQIMTDYFGVERSPEREDGASEDRDRGDRKQTKKAKRHKKGKGKKRGLPPGLAKKKRLPPGLARHLERRGKLPPGLAKRELPQRLETTLPDPWPGTERKIVGNDVVLLEKGTDLILDVLRDVILR